MFSMITRMCAKDGATIDQVSHWDLPLLSGRPIDGVVSKPIEFEIDLDNDGRRMPTFFTTPAFVATDAFCRDLHAAGVDNTQVYPAVIRNTDTGETFEDYRVLNIVGLIACVDMEASEVSQLGPGLSFLQEIVLREDVVPGSVRVFRLAEDPTKIIVANQVLDTLKRKGYEDIYSEPLTSKA